MTKEQKIEYIISSLEKKLMDYKEHPKLKNFVAEVKASLEAKGSFYTMKLYQPYCLDKWNDGWDLQPCKVKIEKASPKMVARYTTDMKMFFIELYIN